MLKLDQNEHYWYPVPVNMLDEEGRTKKFDFDARFARLSMDERRDFLRRDEDDDRPVPRDIEILERVFKSWRKVQDAEGQELACSDQNRTMLLNIPEVQNALITAWMKSIGIEGKRKN